MDYQIIHRCRIPNDIRLFDVILCGNYIERVLPLSEEASHSTYDVDSTKERNHFYDAGGKLLLPGLVEPHIHMEKALLLSRMPKEADTLQEAIEMTVKLKESFTKEDMIKRSLYLANRLSSYGVTRVRCHVEVDPILGISAMESLLEVKELLINQLDLNIVAFPQEGIFAAPGTAELLEEAVKMGADAIGGITYMDPDLEEHLEFVFKLADKHNLPLDFHADFSLNPEDRAIVRIAEKTIDYNFQGRVAAGHVTSLGAMPRRDALQCAELIAAADIHIMTLPATDLYMNGRKDEENVRRGLTPVRMLLDQGVNVIYGANNIRNAFTPFGTGNVMDIAWLLAHTAYMGSEKDAKLLIDMATRRAARATGLPNYGIAPGQTADLALFSVQSERELLIERSRPVAVWKKGIKLDLREPELNIAHLSL